MALPPYPSRRDAEKSGHPNSEQMVSRQQGDICKAFPKRRGDCHGVGSKDRAHGGADNCHQRQDGQDCIALPKWPVLEVHLLGRVPRNHIQSEKGQRTNGSLGSSLGCGTSTMGTGPERSYLSPGVSSSGCR